MLCDKVRIRFRKAGDLRLVSHHDLMRCWERMLRRAELPFHSTSGFNPKPRLIFAQSLGLGIVGCEEVAELELTAEVPAEEVGDRLRRQAPIGLDILEVRRVPIRANAMVRRATYRIEFPKNRVTENREPRTENEKAENCDSAVDAAPSSILGSRFSVLGYPVSVETVQHKADELLGAPEVWTERQHPHPRRINIRPYLNAFRITPEAVEMALLVTPNGAARPDEVLVLLGLGGLLAAGGVLQRVRLEIDDELPPDTDIPPLNLTREPAADSGGVAASPGKPSGPKAPSEKRPEPLMPGPLDY